MCSIDLNCDLGESFGHYQLGDDAAMMDYVSSVNIACGFHAGDASVMRRTVALAVEKQVAIGVHPGLPDLQGFGRRAMQISTNEAYEICLYQIGALYAFVKAAGASIHHLKPHGALYHMAAVDLEIALAIGQAMVDFDGDMMLYGLPGSKMEEGSKQLGLRFVGEAFADRRYEADGMLVSRAKPNALIDDTDEALRQVLMLAKEKKVLSVENCSISLRAQTICLHGDGKRALDFAKAVHARLWAEGITIEAISKSQRNQP